MSALFADTDIDRKRQISSDTDIWPIPMCIPSVFLLVKRQDLLLPRSAFGWNNLTETNDGNFHFVFQIETIGKKVTASRIPYTQSAVCPSRVSEPPTKKAKI